MFPLCFGHSLEISLEALGLLEAESIRALPGSIGRPAIPIAAHVSHCPGSGTRHLEWGQCCCSETVPSTQSFLLIQPRSLLPTGSLLLASHSSGWLCPVALDLSTWSPFSLAWQSEWRRGAGWGQAVVRPGAAKEG